MDDVLQTLLVEAKTGSWLRMSRVSSGSVRAGWAERGDGAKRGGEWGGEGVGGV